MTALMIEAEKQKNLFSIKKSNLIAVVNRGEIAKISRSLDGFFSLYNLFFSSLQPATTAIEI